MPLLDLPYDKVESLINEISIGGKVVMVGTSSGEGIPMFICHPMALDKSYADMEYERSLLQAKEEGFLTLSETAEIMKGKGVFTSEDEIKVKSLESQINAQEKLLERMTRVPARRDSVKENISGLKKKLSEALQKKDQGLDFCAERKAQESRYLYLTWRACKDPYTGSLKWATKKLFDSEIDIVVRRNALVEYVRASAGISVEYLRYIARHNLWRIRYITATKTGTNLFDRPIADYSVDQLALAYWSYFYQSIYDMMPDDRPSEGIIEDDPSLDAYMKSYSDEMGRQATASREKKSSGKGGMRSAWDHGETLVMKSNPLFKDIDYSDTVESLRNKSSTDLNVKK
jgi:hypothetical protein